MPGEWIVVKYLQLSVYAFSYNKIQTLTRMYHLENCSVLAKSIALVISPSAHLCVHWTTYLSNQSKLKEQSERRPINFYFLLCWNERNNPPIQLNLRASKRLPGSLGLNPNAAVFDWYDVKKLLQTKYGEMANRKIKRVVEYDWVWIGKNGLCSKLQSSTKKYNQYQIKLWLSLIYIWNYLPCCSDSQIKMYLLMCFCYLLQNYTKNDL